MSASEDEDIDVDESESNETNDTGQLASVEMRMADYQITVEARDAETARREALKVTNAMNELAKQGYGVGMQELEDDVTLGDLFK